MREPGPGSAVPTRILSLFFFASGASALVYQIVWIRSAGLVIGNTTAALGTVVGVFMAGLGLGSALAGRIIARRAHEGRPLEPVRAYGLIEIAVGVVAGAVPLLFSALGPVFGALYPYPRLFSAARIVFSAAILLPPTILMGATLPLLVQQRTGEGKDAARATGILYAINSLGAVLGAALAGFLLVPRVGLMASTAVAASANVAIGLLALTLRRRLSATTVATRDDSLLRGRLSGRARLAIGAYAASGFAALVYEIAWVRALTLSLGSTVYAFTLILCGFVGGLAAGSWLFARHTRKTRDPIFTFGAFQLGIGMWALGLCWVFGVLPLFVAERIARWSGNFALLHAAHLAVVLLCVAVPCALMGALLPLVMRAADPHPSQAGPVAGRVVAWNTWLCVAGSLVGSLVLIPLVGVEITLRIAVGVNLLLATGCLLLSGAGRRRRGLALGVAVAWLGILVLPRWDLEIVSSGAYIYGAALSTQAQTDGRSVRQQMTEQDELEAAYWDEYGLVSVHRWRTGETILRVNGKVDASSAPSDMATQRLLAHIPMMLAESPRDVLVVGLGSGVTLAEVLRYPVTSAECVEISRAMVRGSEHFRALHRGALDDARSRLIVGDARAHLRHARQSYDVIISEPSNLWVSGMAALFTRELFADAKARLRPGGLFAQWIHAYALSTDDFRGVVRTLSEVFPEVSLWATSPGSDYVLVASHGPRRPLYRRVEETIRSHALTPELREIGLRDPIDLLSLFVLDDEGIRALAQGARSITDDHTWIEYSAPRSMHKDNRASIVEALRPYWKSATSVLRDVKEAGAEIDRAGQARRLLTRVRVESGTLSPQQQAALLDEADRLRPGDGMTRQAADRLARDLLRQAMGLAETEAWQQSIAALDAVPRSSGLWAEARRQAGAARLKLNEPEAALREFEASRAATGGEGEAMLGIAEAQVRLGRFDQARRICEEILRARPDSTVARLLLVMAHRRSGNTDAARRELDTLARAHPGNPHVLRLKAELERGP